MAKGSTEFFTEKERAAFEWSRCRRKEGRRRSGSRDGSRHRSRRERHYSDSSDSDNLRELFNPLKLAHICRRECSRLPRDGKPKDSDPMPSESPERWEHDLYSSDTERAAESAAYRRRKADMNTSSYAVDTRRGAWKSRAGGVYIPPEDDIDAEKDLYSSHKPRSKTDTARKTSRSRSYERPDPVYELD